MSSGVTHEKPEAVTRATGGPPSRRVDRPEARSDVTSLHDRSLRSGGLKALPAVVVIAACSAALGIYASSALVTVAAVIDLLVLAIAVRVVRPAWSAPGLLVALYTTVIGIGGLLVGNSLGTSGTGDVRVLLTRDQIASTFALFMLASVLIVLPSVLIWRRLPVHAMADIVIPRKVDRWFLATSGLVAAASVAALGPAWILSRDSRFDGVSTATSVVSLIALGGVVAAGPVVQRGGRWSRTAGIVLVLLFSAIFFSAASRFLCLVPIALLAGMVLLGGRRKHVGLSAVVAGALAIVLLPIPLFLRGYSPGGLIPYLIRLGDFRFSPSSFGQYANNILVSFRITGATAYTEPRMPLSWFWTSVAPGSGGSVGWYDIAPEMRLNPISPYAGLGELANWGVAPLIISLLVIGVVMAAIAGWSVYMSRSPLGMAVGAAVIAVQLLFAVQFTQYNLRSSVRLLYYSAALEIVVALVVLSIGFVRRRLRAGRSSQHGVS